MALDLQLLVDRLRTVLGGEDACALHEPCFGGREWEYVKSCLDEGWVSSAGRYVDAFEDQLAAACGVNHAVAIVNGTAALHAALLLAGVGPGCEVIVPTLTFVGTVNAIAHCGAQPHFADSDPITLGLDPEKLARHLEACTSGDDCRNRVTGNRIAAIVPMHTFGHAVDMDGLCTVAERFGIPMIEDAAEAIGSTYRGKPLGSFGLAGVLSFNGNKTLTTGGGGAILTNDATFARDARHLSTTAKKAHRWEFDHDRVAFNYRMPNLNAALGVAQLEQLDGFLARKRALAGSYAEAVRGVQGVRFFEEPPHSRSNYWLNAILLDDDAVNLRDEVLARTNEVGIGTRPVWKLMHRLPMFAVAPRMDLSVAEDLERRIVNIPSSVRLGMAHAA